MAASERPESGDQDTTLGLAAAVIAVCVALLPPAGYFALGYAALSAEEQTKAQVQADAAGQVVAATPDTWRYQEHRLREILQRVSRHEHDYARVVASDGSEVASIGQAPGRLSLTSVAGLYDSGNLVGRVEHVHPLGGLLARTAGAGLLGGLLGAAVFGLLARLLRRARFLNAALFEAKERAEVTLHSIGDAVITTGTGGAVEYLNPAASALTGWTLAEARGRPLDEVLRLIDEETLDSVPSPLARAISENGVRSFSRQTALLRADGSSVAIEDSAAPIRDREGNVTGGVIVFHDVSTARSMAQRLTWQATHDALTGLANRREFENRADAALASARNGGKQHVVCCLDLDQFKVVNDTSGHPAGDELLRQIAALLQAKVRESDTLARLGGDEFGLVLDGCSLERGRLIAADILSAVRDFRFNWEGRTFSVGVSIGVAAMNSDSASRAEVVSAADSALFAAKEQGRNRVCVYRGADDEMASRRREMSWVSRINRALEEGRFVLYHQRYLPLKPEGDAATHIEVLLRMIDEEGGLVLPGSFIPAAERYNLMPAVDRWVVREVFSRYRGLVGLFGGGPLVCSVNLSGSSLGAEGFLDFIRGEAAAHSLPPGAICFEITETAAINNLRQAAAFIREVKALGFLFALDDFGTGTSSFGYLKNLPVDYLKIDGGFVKDLVDDPLDRAMTETINRIGHIVGLKTVAEFAENDGVIAGLRAMGVDFAQGHGVAVAQPLPGAAAPAP